MKKNYIIVLFSMFSSLNYALNQTCNSILLQDDFTTQHVDWNFTGSNISINNGELIYGSIPGNSENRAIRQLSRSISDTYFKTELTYNIASNTANHGVSGVLAALTTNNSDFASVYNGTTWSETDNDGICVIVASDSHTDENIDNWYFLVEGKDGTSRTWDMTTRINLSSMQTTYYLVLERMNSSQVKLSAYSDQAHTQHIPGSPTITNIQPSITNLNYFQSGIFISSYASRMIDATIDDLSICDDILTNEIQEYEKNNILFPNPTIGMISFSEPNDIKELLIYSINGEIVKKQGGNFSEINISELQSGIYFIQVDYSQNKKTSTKIKLIKN